MTHSFVATPDVEGNCTVKYPNWGRQKWLCVESGLIINRYYKFSTSLLSDDGLDLKPLHSGTVDKMKLGRVDNDSVASKIEVHASGQRVYRCDGLDPNTDTESLLQNACWHAHSDSASSLAKFKDQMEAAFIVACHRVSAGKARATVIEELGFYDRMDMRFCKHVSADGAGPTAERDRSDQCGS